MTPEDILQIGNSTVDGSVASARELCWLYNNGTRSMRDIDQPEVTKMNAALKNARFKVANDGKKIKPTGGIPTTYFVVGQLPVNIGSWSAIVKDRLFWMQLQASEQGRVATTTTEVAGTDKY